MRKMYDNTGLPAHPPDVEVTAFYVGGKDPFRVWPQKEIDGIKTRWRLPIWVNDKPTNAEDGFRDGILAARTCARLGQPKGTCIALDLEMARNKPYTEAFDRGTRSIGYKTIAYGSEAYVFENGNPSGGFWVAQWDGKAELKKGWAAKQYANDTMIGHPWDLSVVADDTPLWDTQKGSDMATPAEMWSYEIAVPDYGRMDHPGTDSIPAAGWLRGTEHQVHAARADIAALSTATHTEIAALSAKVDALTALVNQLLTAGKTGSA